MVYFTCSINIHQHQWFNLPTASIYTNINGLIYLQHQYTPTSMVYFTCSFNKHQHQWFIQPAASIYTNINGLFYLQHQHTPTSASIYSTTSIVYFATSSAISINMYELQLLFSIKYLLSFPCLHIRLK